MIQVETLAQSNHHKTETTMAKQSRIAPPVISSRNKSLVSLRESLQEGFLEHNINNKSQTTLLPVIEEKHVRKPAFISPNNSNDNLHNHLTMVLEKHQHQQQHQLKEENQDGVPTPRPFKKRKVVSSAAVATAALHSMTLEAKGPATTAATIAAAEAEEERHEEETLNRKRKALAAMLRAGDLARKLVLTPSDFARRIFSKNTKTPIEMPSFPEPSEMDLEIHAKHSRVLYNFVRKGTDLEGFKKCLRDLQNTYHGSQTKGETTYAQPFRCSNRFGESLMHLACRRGRTEMVRFLVEDLPGGNPSQMLSIKDDCHKTPLHDACWTPDPNFELVELILEHAPEQVLMQDVRGNTPFDYVRKEDHGLWLRFLWERRSLLVAKRPKAPATEPPQIPTELIV